MNNRNLWLLQVILVLAFCSTLSCKKSSDTAPALEITYKGTARKKCDLTFQSNLKTNSYIWNFGDGSKSTLASPVHAYSTTGTFAVKLFINGDSSNIVTKKIYVDSACSITYTGLYMTGSPIVFSSNADTSSKLQWDFGDGATSTSFSPAHIYNSSRSYTVELIVDGERSNPVFVDITIVKDPIYTHSICRLRNWHHVTIAPTSSIPYYTTTYEDVSFSINYIDPLTVNIGLDTFRCESVGPDDLLTFNWQVSPYKPYTYGTIKYYYTTDSIVVHKNIHWFSAYSSNETFTTY